MKIEIWSDVVCPFCYIGKRKFESALVDFARADEIEIEWKSFQLNPELKTDPSSNINQYLAVHKGISLDQAAQLNDHVTQMAKRVGLDYHFEKAVVANTFNAHRFIHFAKEQGRQDVAKERLMKAYFTEGKNIDDLPTLLELGSDIGLDKKALSEVLESHAFAVDVNADIAEAQKLGIRGVPFFVFDRKYGVSGAQEKETFINVLEKVYEDGDTNIGE